MIMTKQEILTKAIEKAVEGGWDRSNDLTQQLYDACKRVGVRDVKFISEVNQEHFDHMFHTIIFSHDFLKAFFGEETMKYEQLASSDCDLNKEMEVAHHWQYHAQQMVLSEDPIEYLGQFLDQKYGVFSSEGTVPHEGKIDIGTGQQ